MSNTFRDNGKARRKRGKTAQVKHSKRISKRFKTTMERRNPVAQEATVN